MATWLVKRKQIKELEKNMRKLGSRLVYFQTTHHGGCLQVATHKDIHDVDYKHLNLFIKCTSGWKGYMDKLYGRVGPVYELPLDWIDTMLESEYVKLSANIKKDTVHYKIKYIPIQG
jgi:hypothetical protein